MEPAVGFEPDDLLIANQSLRVRSFFEPNRTAVLNVGPWLVIGFMEQHIVQLSPINHFSASAFVEVPFLRFAQLVKVSGIHFS